MSLETSQPFANLFVQQLSSGWISPAEAGCVPPAPRLIFALFSESGTQPDSAGTQPDSAGLVQPLDNCCGKVLGSTRTQLAESETFAGLVSPAGRLIQITT